MIVYAAPFPWYCQGMGIPILNFRFWIKSTVIAVAKAVRTSANDKTHALKNF